MGMTTLMHEQRQNPQTPWIQINVRALADNLIFIVLWVGFMGIIEVLASLIHKNRIYWKLSIYAALFVLGLVLMLTLYHLTLE
jgi:hypothetical protein